MFVHGVVVVAAVLAMRLLEQTANFAVAVSLLDLAMVGGDCPATGRWAAEMSWNSVLNPIVGQTACHPRPCLGSLRSCRSCHSYFVAAAAAAAWSLA